MSGVNTIGLSADERASILERELEDQRAAAQLAGMACMWIGLIAGAAIIHPIDDGAPNSIVDYLKYALGIIVAVIGFLLGVGAGDAKSAWYSSHSYAVNKLREAAKSSSSASPED